MITNLGHTVIYTDIIVTFCYLRSLFCFQTKTIFLKIEERVEEREVTSIMMNYKPSSRKTISLLTKKQNKIHDEKMNEVKQKMIKSKLKQPTQR